MKRKMGYGSKIMKRPASKKDKPLKKEASSKKGKPLKKRPASNIDPHKTWTSVQCYLPREKLYHRVPGRQHTKEVDCGGPSKVDQRL